MASHLHSAASCSYMGYPFFLTHGDTVISARAAGVMFSALLLLPLPAAADQPDWSYTGADTSEPHWYDLRKEYGACELGNEQSPIDIDDAQPSFLPPMDFQYREAKMRLQKQYYTLQLVPGEQQAIEADGITYYLKEIRLHTPGEHAVKDKLFPLEIQFMHEDANGHRLFVAVLAKLGAPNPALDTILAHAPQAMKAPVAFAFNPAGLLPGAPGYYAYDGSVTFAPCTQGVKWRVMKRRITFSRNQLDALGQFMGRNSRQLQSIYERTIKSSVQ